MMPEPWPSEIPFDEPRLPAVKKPTKVRARRRRLPVRVVPAEPPVEEVRAVVDRVVAEVLAGTPPWSGQFKLAGVFARHPAAMLAALRVLHERTHAPSSPRERTATSSTSTAS